MCTERPPYPAALAAPVEPYGAIMSDNSQHPTRELNLEKWR